MLFGNSSWDQNVSCYILMFFSSILEIPNVDIPIWYAFKNHGRFDGIELWAV